MEPENGPLEEEIPFENPSFSGSMALNSGLGIVLICPDKCLFYQFLLG